jgi:hypothetical protein
VVRLKSWKETLSEEPVLDLSMLGRCCGRMLVVYEGKYWMQVHGGVSGFELSQFEFG